MADYIGTKIFLGLAGRLYAQMPDMPQSAPNRNFNAPADGKYLVVNHLPNDTEQTTLGDEGYNRHEGLFQVTVVWPEGDYAANAMEVAGRVVDHFKRGTVIAYDGIAIRLPRPPSMASPLTEGGRFQIPVTIPYAVDAPN